MEFINKYRIVLLKDYEDNKMAVTYLEWAKNDTLLPEQRIETPNSKVDMFKVSNDLLFIYTNKVETNNPLESEQSEFVDQYISLAAREASSMNAEFILVDNTSGRQQEQLLFQAMDRNMRSYYNTVWNILGKNEAQINELKQIYSNMSSYTPVEEPVINVSEPKEEKVDATISVEEENKPNEVTDRELLVEALNKINQLSIQVKELREILTNRDSMIEAQIAEGPRPTEVETPEVKEEETEKEIKEEDLLSVRNYAADVENDNKEKAEVKNEGVPVVDPEDDANDNVGNAAVGGLYQNAVFYPKNPTKRADTENEPAQMSQTETETLVAEVPEEKDKTPISSSKGNESTEETVIYNSVDKTETLWENILGQVGTESELSELIVEHYSELPREIQDDFLRFNMIDKYKSGKTTTLSKVEAVKRKVKVKRI